MEVGWVIEFRRPVFPGLPTILGSQNHAIGTHHKTVVLVFEPDIKERVNRPDFHICLGVFEGEEQIVKRPLQVSLLFFRSLFNALFQLSNLVFLAGNHQLGGLNTIELQLPGLPGIAGMQHNTAVANHPAMLLGAKINGGQRDRHRHLGLRPRLALIVGIDYVPTLTH